jgi:tripartite-type tricarboxylate transporter receptor subunit TctC
MNALYCRNSLLVCAFLAAPLLGLAQAPPSKPVRLISQFAAGTPGDTVARAFAILLSQTAGQPIVVDARPGGGGIIAALAVARAAPDGDTLLNVTAGVPVILSVLGKSLPLDPVRDLTPITTLAGDVTVLLVGNPAAPASSLETLIAYAKANPGKLSYGTTGVGSPHHLSGEQIKLLTGADIVHVPYKTSPVLDAVSGGIPIAFVIASQAIPFVNSGKLKVLAVVHERRYRGLPDVPTVTETIPGFQVPPSWTGLFGPAALPQPIARRIQAAAVKAMVSPEGKAHYEQLGYEVMITTPEEFSALIKRQIEMVARIAKGAGIPQID